MLKIRVDAWTITDVKRTEILEHLQILAAIALLDQLEPKCLTLDRQWLVREQRRRIDACAVILKAADVKEPG